MFEQIPRWRVTLGSSLLLAGAGVWFLAPSLLIAAMVPVVFLAYGALTRTPPIDDGISLERSVTPQQTYPGGTVVVELTVENQTGRSMADLRIVDGVPPALPVIDGSPRAAVSLSAEETATIEYTLRARYGEFEFDAVRLQSRDLSATTSYTTEQPATGATQLSATLDPEEFPLPQQTTGLAGQLTADRGGEGLEFHSIRAYQPEDPINRINWRQYARERELSTIDYRQQEAAAVLVVIDARPSAAVASAETEPTGTELCVYAGIEIINGLLTAQNRAGLAVLGIDGADRSGQPVVSPGTDRRVRIQIQQLLDDAAATVSPGAEPGDADADPDPLELLQQLSPDTQLLVISPLVDEYPVQLARQAQTTGHTVSVYSPAVTTQSSVGGTISAVDRELRLLELRRLGTTVVDWQPEDPLDLALAQMPATSATISQP